MNAKSIQIRPAVYSENGQPSREMTNSSYDDRMGPDSDSNFV
jgi:hypothetical protein